jgi:hypothetical protein
LAQDANGLNYFKLPIQASFVMTNCVVETSGLNHRTYRKSAITPNLLLQANAARSGERSESSSRRLRVAWLCYAYTSSV